MTNTETSGTKPVRVRFAPSPTGYIHLGNVRAALFNWMFARASEGTFVLRIEDTDLERHVEGSDRDICEVLSWLGLNWGEGPRVGGAYGPYYQTQRLETYQQIAQRLLDEGLAYYDFSQAPDREASPAEQSHEIVWESPDARLDPAEAKKRVEAGEPHCVRMRVPAERYPNRVVAFQDKVHGTIRKDVEDFVIVKTNGIPTYHFAVVCDDQAMAITHVVRGIGHLDNTAKHAVLYDALGWERPQWAHHSHTKGLSKRKGSPSVGDFMRRGYLPEAIGNVCLLMGWFPKDGKELFTIEERLADFRIEDLNTAQDASFDEGKFAHICRWHMERAETERVLNLARPFLETSGFIAEGAGRGTTDPLRPKLLAVIECLKGKVTHAAELLDHLGPFRTPITIDEDARACLAEADARLAVEETKKAFLELVPEGTEATAELFKAMTKQASKSAPLKEKKIKGRGYFHPLRAALTGALVGPDLAAVFVWVGRDEVLRRLDAALAVSGEG